MVAGNVPNEVISGSSMSFLFSSRPVCWKIASTISAVVTLHDQIPAQSEAISRQEELAAEFTAFHHVQEQAHSPAKDPVLLSDLLLNDKLANR